MNAREAGRGSVVAVGVFDGLHLGHVHILECALGHAREAGLPCLVLSFDPHPDVVLSKTFRVLAPLTPIHEKRARLRALGVDELHVLPFTRELAALDPVTFVERHLLEAFGMRHLVVGEGFALGRGRAGDVPMLTELGRTRGFRVDAVGLIEMDGAPVSSTRIRGLLAEGRVAEAGSLLGRRYDLTGAVVSGHAMGRTLGYPTANLRLHEEKFVPADGVYAAWVTIQGDPRRVPSAASIGTRPTFGGDERAIEAYLIDWSGQLAGREVSLELADWIRGQERFDGPEPLVAAMDRDVAEVRRRLVLPAAGPGAPASGKLAPRPTEC